MQAEEAAAELEGIEGVGELKTALSKIGPRVAKVVAKVFEILAIFQQIAQNLHDTLEDVARIVADLREEIEKINRLNFIFLPQNNKRERIKTENGETIYRRIPNSPIN